jgi:hypothetical protein
LRAGLAGLAHIGSVFGHGLHDVHGNQSVALRGIQRHADFAIQCNQVHFVQQRLVMAAPGPFHKIRMMMPQVDAGDGAHGTRLGHCTSQPVRGHAHPHAALHDG